MKEWQARQERLDNIHQRKARKIVKSPVLQLRVALTAQDYETVFAFYHEALGLDPAQDWSTEQARGLMFDMGQASLEIFDEAYASNVDKIEVGKRVSGQIRFALQVP